MPLRLVLALVLLACPAVAVIAAPLHDARILPAPRADMADGNVAVVVERPADATGVPETYVVVVRPSPDGGVPLATLFIGAGAVVDDIRADSQSVDVSYRDHWPVDRPGEPTRQNVRAFAVPPSWANPAWARPAWAAPADLPRISLEP
ncbi:MAG: hypothetical protein ACOC3D_07220 [Pseudomonadota bacterium]